jgi:hypothetical protein
MLATLWVASLLVVLIVSAVGLKQWKRPGR